MTRRLLPATLLLAGLCLVPEAGGRAFAQGFIQPGPFGRARIAPVAPGLVAKGMQPFQPQSFVDTKGMNWDIQQGGWISSGTNRTFSGASNLIVDGSTYNPPSGMMSQDRKSFVFTGNRNGWMLTRRIFVDEKAGVVRYVDSATNTMPNNRVLRLGVMHNHGRSNANRVVANRSESPMPGKEDEGLVTWTMPQFGQVSALFHVADRGAEVRPALNNSNNRTFRFDWSLPVAPKETVSIAHVIGQRRWNAAPSKRNIAKEFADLRSTRWLESLPAEVRRTIRNRRLGVPMQLGPSVLSANQIDVEVGELDVLAIGAETRLFGTAEIGKITVETRFGKIEVPADRLRTIVGPRHPAGTMGVDLADGQCLTGRPTFEPIAFALRGGLSTNVESGQLDRLVVRRPAEPMVVAEAILETVHGDRLAFDIEKSDRLPATTPWGRRLVEWSEVERMTAQESGGFVLQLKDGTKTFSFLDVESLSFETREFGRRTLHPAELRFVQLPAPPKKAEPPKPEEGSVPEPKPPLFELVGANKLAGRLAVDRLRFATSAQEVAVSVDQIRLITGSSTSDDGERTWEVRLWNGSRIQGRLLDQILVVEAGPEDRIRIPARDLERFSVPTIPTGIRSLVTELLVDLGDTEFDKRDAATRELALLAGGVEPILKAELEKNPSLEVRKRIERVLEKADPE